MKRCCIQTCRAIADHGNVRFFAFPSEKSDAKRRRKWINKVTEWNDDEEWTAKPWSYICGGHFMFGEYVNNNLFEVFGCTIYKSLCMLCYFILPMLIFI